MSNDYLECLLLAEPHSNVWSNTTVENSTWFRNEFQPPQILLHHCQFEVCNWSIPKR